VSKPVTYLGSVAKVPKKTLLPYLFSGVWAMSFGRQDHTKWTTNVGDGSAIAIGTGVLPNLNNHRRRRSGASTS
jgi:hypothetical protein